MTIHRHCEACDEALPPKSRKHRKYCDASCRMWAYRLAKKVEAARKRKADRTPRIEVVEQVLSLGEQVRCKCCGLSLIHI